MEFMKYLHNFKNIYQNDHTIPQRSKLHLAKREHCSVQLVDIIIICLPVLRFIVFTVTI